MNEELQRVSLNLNQAILEFWKQRLNSADPQFTSTDLRQFVQRHNYGTSPSSADRVLRSLKKSGKINYTLLSRPRSIYRADPLIVEAKVEGN